MKQDTISTGLNAKGRANGEPDPNSFSGVIILVYAAVAQLDRVLGYEPRGRGFNSCRPRHHFSIKSALKSMG